MPQNISSDEETTIKKESSTIESINVLLVDDEEDFLEMTSIYLSRINPLLRIDYISDPERIFEKIFEKEYHAIVSDYQMPRMNGLELLEMIRNQRIDIPFIIFTGRGREEVAIDALNLGANHYIQKGGDPESQYSLLVRAIIREVELQRAEKKAVLEQERAFSYLNIASISMMALNSEGIVTLVNRKLCDVLGYREEEIVGKNWFDHFIPKRDIEIKKKIFTNILIGQISSIKRAEANVVTKNGEEKTMSWYTNPVSDHTGRITSTLSSGDDITEKKLDGEKIRLADKALIKEKERVQQFLDIAAVIIVVMNSEGIVTQANKKACEVLDYPVEEIIGKNWFDHFIPARIRDQVREVFGLLVKGEIEPVERFNNLIITRNGDEKVIAWHNTIVKGESDTIIGTISSGSDITRQIQTERRNKRLSTVLKTIRNVNQLLTKKKDRNILLEGVCKDLVGTRGYLSAFIVLIDESGKRTAFSIAGLDDRLDLLQDYMNGNKLPYCCVAARGIPGVLVILDKASSCGDCLLIEESYSAMSTRLEYDGKILGVLTVNIPSNFITEEEEISLIEDLGENVAFALNLIELEETLKESEAQQESLLKAAPIGLGQLVNRKFRWVNAGFAEMLGYSIEELIGKDTRILYEGDEEYQRIEREVYPALEKFGVTSTDVQLRRKDGQPVDVHFRITRINSADINKGVIFGVLDITERIMMEKDLRDSEARQESILRVAPVGIGFLVDRKIQWVSNTLLEMMGYKEEEILGKSTKIFYPSDEDYIRVGREIYADVEKYGTGSIDSRLICKNGSILEVDLRLTTLDPDDQSKDMIFTVQDITNRKIMEKSLKYSEELYRAVVKDQVELICRSLPDLTHTFMNEAYCQFFGKSKEELIGSSILNYIPKEEHENVKQDLSSINETNPVIKIEHKVIHNDGKNRWLQWIDRGIFNDDGQLLEIQSVGRDITERKLAEKRLEESEKKYREIFEAIPDIFFLFSEDGTCLDYSGKEEDLYIKPKEFINKSVIDLLPREIGELLLGSIKEALRTKKPQEIEYSLPIKGDIRYFEARVYYFSEKRVMAFIRNITEEKKTGDALWESERRFRDFVKYSHDGICLTDEDGIYIAWNNSMEEITGLRSGDVIGQRVWDVQQEVSIDEHKTVQFADHMKEMINSLLKDGKATWTNKVSEYEILLKNGIKKSIEVVLFPIETQKGYMIGGIIRDITASKLAEGNLEKQKQELSQFAHFMAHDLRNNLNIIDGFADMLSDKYDISHVDKIVKNTQSMTKILSRSLELADAGLVIKRSEEVDLNTLVEEVAELTISAGIQFSHDELPKVSCDRDKMIQVFQNIFGNAVIHGKPDQIEISVHKEDDSCVISISNNGIKINPAIQDKLLSYGFTTKPGNSGLGLTIVNKIIEAHGWYIRLETIPDTKFQIVIKKEDIISKYSVS